MGYESLYNNDNPTKLRYEAMLDDKTIYYIAVRDIKKDEEFTINYNAGGGSHTFEEDSCFKQHNIVIF